MRTLKLTLKSQPFEVMRTFEKCNEFRKPSDWIKSRLYNKDGTVKEYDFIEFTHGYGSTRPKFTAFYCGFTICKQEINFKYSNGLEVKVEVGDFVICFLPYKNAEKEINYPRTYAVNVGDRRKRK